MKTFLLKKLYFTAFYRYIVNYLVWFQSNIPNLNFAKTKNNYVGNIIKLYSIIL